MSGWTLKSTVRGRRVGGVAWSLALVLSVALLFVVGVRDSEATGGFGRLWRSMNRKPGDPVPPDEEGARQEAFLKRRFTITDGTSYAAHGVRDLYVEFPSLDDGLTLAACAWVRKNGLAAYTTGDQIVYEKSEYLMRRVGESESEFAKRAREVCDAAEASCVALGSAQSEIEISGVPLNNTMRPQTALTAASGRPGKLLVSFIMGGGGAVYAVGADEPSEPQCGTLTCVASRWGVQFSGLLCSSPEETERWLQEADVQARSSQAGRSIVPKSNEWPGATVRVRIALGFACGPSNPATAGEWRAIREAIDSGNLQPMQGMLIVPVPRVTFEILSLSVEEGGNVLATLTPRKAVK